MFGSTYFGQGYFGQGYSPLQTIITVFIQVYTDLYSTVFKDGNFGYVLREDSGYILREDGGRIVREDAIETETSYEDYYKR